MSAFDEFFDRVAAVTTELEHVLPLAIITRAEVLEAAGIGGGADIEANADVAGVVGTTHGQRGMAPGYAAANLGEQGGHMGMGDRERSEGTEAWDQERRDGSNS